jgi:soluble lytic murein transglycosylase-like protein
MKLDHAKRQELLWSAIAALLIVFIGLMAPRQSCAAEPVPHQAAIYRNDLVRNARLVWGLNAPIATFAAQVHQESGWNARAVSRVGAKGLAQFMPATADWIGGIDPALVERQPDNPVWALRALAIYDRWLWDRIQAETACDRMAMVLSSYNGGLGWLLKDKALAATNASNRSRWWGHVERFNAGRSLAAWTENRGYPRRILTVLEPRYAAWGARSCA